MRSFDLLRKKLWRFGTALGTTLLAGVTGALALTTARDVKATQDLAAQGRRRDVLEQRPMVMAERITYWALSGDTAS